MARKRPGIKTRLVVRRVVAVQNTRKMNAPHPRGPLVESVGKRKVFRRPQPAPVRKRTAPTKPPPSKPKPNKGPLEAHRVVYYRTRTHGFGSQWVCMFLAAVYAEHTRKPLLVCQRLNAIRGQGGCESISGQRKGNDFLNNGIVFNNQD